MIKDMMALNLNILIIISIGNFITKVKNNTSIWIKNLIYKQVHEGLIIYVDAKVLLEWY